MACNWFVSFCSYFSSLLTSFLPLSPRSKNSLLFRCPILSTLFKHKHGPNQSDDEPKMGVKRLQGGWKIKKRGAASGNVMPAKMLQMVENA